MPDKLVNLRDHLKGFSLPGAKFSVSARHVSPYLDMRAYLKLYYTYVDIARIDSVFGFVLFSSPLYGGRIYNAKRALTNIHLSQINEMGVKLSLNLTNHYFDDALYEMNRAFLERHHVEGNSITCTSNRLAKNIKRDFPRYLVRASIIKKLNTLDKIEAALEIYDQVVLPMEKNDDDTFLEALPWKERIMLFANATCAYACPDRTCWLGFSQRNLGKKETAGCTKTTEQRKQFGKTFFDVEKFHRMGYRNFKLIPAVVPEYAEAAAKMFSARSKPESLLDRYLDKSSFYLCSFPKSGRTWLRYLLANYLNLKFRLGLTVDFKTLFQLIPNDDVDEEKGFGIYDYFDDKRFPLILASHDVYIEEKFGRRKIIFLIRSVLDTVVSNYFQHSRVFSSDLSWKGTIREFIRSKKGVVSFCAYLNSWSDFLEGNHSALILSYENLHHDLWGTTKRVLELMGVPIEEQTLAHAIELSSFEAMKETEKKTKIPGAYFNFSPSDGESARVRKGKVGGYRDYLDDEDIEYIRNYCDENLSPQSKKLLMQYECLM